VLGSGVSALAGTFFTFLKSGDHVVCSDVSYIAVYRLLHQYLPEKYNIEATLVDTADLDALRKAVRPNTKLIHIETPGNPTTRISDIAEIAKIAKQAGALLSVDSTFASPYLQHPLALGADLVIHSLTKYINGHGDSLGGAVIGRRELIDKIKRQAMVNLGGIISPFNAWLIMRGVVTLPLRMRQHSESALAVAKYLKDSPAVRFVAYPGLESDPGHATAAKQMKNGYSGMIAFGLKGDTDAHNRFVSYLRVITSAVSLGHDESLIVLIGADDERQYLYPEKFHGGFFRFSVGLEDTQDIIGDIDQALRKAGF
jgi:cystathionine beta-lyase/cystathionine gamma-synthase